MKHTIITLTLLLCATLSFAQELKVKSFTHDAMSIEARVDGRKDLNGRQCALIKVEVRDDIVDCTGGNVGEIISKGIVKKFFVSPDTKFLKFEFKYNYPLKVTFADYGIKNLAEGGTYTMTLVDANASPQQSSLINNTYATTSDVPSQPIAQSSLSPNGLLIEINGVTFNMIKVDGGTFTMGATSEQEKPDSDEKPAHQVTLSSYYIGETEVTQALWKAVMGTTIREQRDRAFSLWKIYGEGDNYPMYYVSWDECRDFISKLNELTNRKFRLPTEAEWEYAARGGNKSNHTQYCGSSNLDEVAWYWRNSGDKPLSGEWGNNKIDLNNCKTHPVKTKKPNELGIFDMTGNVEEWCCDYLGKYNKKSSIDPIGPDSGKYRVYRGGSWKSQANYCRSANRVGGSSGWRGSDIGFRLALVD